MGNLKIYGKVVVIFLLLIFSLGGFAQISPGELAKAHANLEGISNCVKCHVLGDAVTNEKCLDCHKEIAELQKNNKGYHSCFEVKGKNCVGCHNDHHGLTFEIVKLDDKNFDHKLTGYELVGKHKQIKCEDCHKNEFIKEKISQKTFGHSHLGLKTDCLSCHADYHKGLLGNDCTKCHNFDSFKTPSGFDHQKTNFPLIGQHAKISCEKCHPKEVRNGETFQKFKGIKSKNCTDCHKDFHNGKFGIDCLQCHNQESFQDVKSLDHFDHNKTDYPLLGLHQKVDCKKCHKQNFTIPVKYQLCSDCHTDYHNGQFNAENKSTDCRECHSIDGFSPSLFTIERHNQSEFRLEGGHLAQPCFACHKKTDRWEFRNIGEKCVDCHEDIHKGEIEESFYPGQKCENCHSATAWDQIKFDHTLTSFALEGKHAEQTCRKCHFDEKSDGSFNQKFASLDKNCVNCHTDIHHDQFKVKYQNDCAKCHGFEDWKAEKFNHDNTRFKLEGGHVGVACEKCHPTERKGEATVVMYALKDFKCSDCHSDSFKSQGFDVK
jgi:hypothetical protein